MDVTMMRWHISRTNMEIELTRRALVTCSCESVIIGRHSEVRQRMEKWVSGWRLFDLAGRRCFLSLFLSTEHWPFSGHSQVMISISMPCFLQQGRFRAARPDLTYFQHCLNNTLFGSKAGKRDVSIDINQDTKRSFVFSLEVIDWILIIMVKYNVLNEGGMKGTHEGGSAGEGRWG